MEDFQERFAMFVLMEANKMLKTAVNDLENRVKALEKQLAPKTPEKEQEDWEAEKERILVGTLAKVLNTKAEEVTKPDGRKVYVFGGKADESCDCAICTFRRDLAAKRKAEAEPQEEHNNNEEE